MVSKALRGIMGLEIDVDVFDLILRAFTVVISPEKRLGSTVLNKI